MRARRKKLKVYSITGILSALVLFILPNISWKSVKENNKSTNTIGTIDSLITSPQEVITFNNFVNDIYESADLQASGLALPVFEKAITGFYNLKSNNYLNSTKDVLTIVDFTLSSKNKRMWIIDLKSKSILLNTYVAHGQGSGEDMAKAFSNISESHQSSLGFFVTNETYFGKHGLSLRLDGFDKGVNNLARNRAIVVHGASYVSESFIKQHGRLGRSYGCPAVPEELNNTVIELIKDKTCLFINGNSEQYQSQFLDKKLLETNFAAL